jgi:hypothetical protein
MLHLVGDYLLNTLNAQAKVSGYGAHRPALFVIPENDLPALPPNTELLGMVHGMG